MKTAQKAAPKPGSMNYAALHRDALFSAIDTVAPSQLKTIDADLAREGWSKDGVARTRIAARLAPKSSKSTKE